MRGFRLAARPKGAALVSERTGDAASGCTGWDALILKDEILIQPNLGMRLCEHTPHEHP